MAGFSCYGSKESDKQAKVHLQIFGGCNFIKPDQAGKLV